MFACDCDTDNGWCYKVRGMGGCYSSRGYKDHEEYCPDRRRRKRSIHLAVSQVYSGLYSHLLERDAMENFLSFDLNRDGLISWAEAMETSGSNATIGQFKEVDLDNDGFVQPSEFDLSLV